MKCHAKSAKSSLNHSASKGFSNICTRGDFHLKLLVEKVPIFTRNSWFSVYLRERMDMEDNEWVFFFLEVRFYLNGGQKY